MYCLPFPSAVFIFIFIFFMPFSCCGQFTERSIHISTSFVFIRISFVSRQVKSKPKTNCELIEIQRWCIKRLICMAPPLRSSSSCMCVQVPSWGARPRIEYSEQFIVVVVVDVRCAITLYGLDHILLFPRFACFM